MSYHVDVLADSISPQGARLTTFIVTFPRFLLAEVNTHRMLSRNSASSRAIPPEKIIKRVMEEPFVPNFNKRVKGMGVGEALGGMAQDLARVHWLKARDTSVDVARQLVLLDVDKSRVNRLLEPFMWHTAIISGTEWDNFFAQRTEEGAQPEFITIATMMREAMLSSKPIELQPGDWHVPMVNDGWMMEEETYDESDPLFWPMVSAGRVARVSFDTHWKDEDPYASHERTLRLTTSGHWSPLEHPAMCMNDYAFRGNFCGFRQLRKFYDNEDNYMRLKEMQNA